MKITCKVIESLLPLYIDDLVSDDSIALVEEHLESCENCNVMLKELKEGEKPIYDIDDVTGNKLASSNTLVKIKKDYHWFLMNIGLVLFLISAVCFFWVSDILNNIMYVNQMEQVLVSSLLSFTFIGTVVLAFVRFFCKNISSSTKDKLNKITIVTTISLSHFMFIFSVIDNYNLLYTIGSILASMVGLLFVGLYLYKIYNLSFTLTNDYYIKNAVWFLIITAGILSFDKFKLLACLRGWNGNAYWFYSNVITVVNILILLVFAIKLHNFDTDKPKQIITKEYTILQSILVLLSVFLQWFCVLLYNLKFKENPFDENIMVLIRTSIDLSNIFMIFVTLIISYCLYMIFSKKQYIMVWIMLQTFAMLSEKVWYLDIVLGNMDDPSYLPLNIFWVFYLTLIPTGMYVLKLNKAK